MNRNLSPNIAKGMFGGPKTIKGGDYLRANIGLNSGGLPNLASYVNGNLDTVRKPAKSAKIKP